MFARDAYNVLVSKLSAAVSGVSPQPIVAIGWPTERALMGLAKSSNTIVSVYDPGFSRDASRFMLFTANEVVTDPGITSTLALPIRDSYGDAVKDSSGNIVFDSGSPAISFKDYIAVELGGDVLINDAVSFVAGRGRTMASAIAVADLTDTPETMASELAASINAEATLSQWVTASASGNIVTVQNNLLSLLTCASNVGNIGTRYQETHRLIRDVQVDVWSGTDAQRVKAAKPVDQQLSYLDAHFGAQGNGTTDDGTWVRVRYLGDRFIDEDVYRDIYRWMFRATLEYGQTYAEALYSVLAFLPSQTAQVGEETLRP